MRFKLVWMAGIIFSWLMALLSWRFAHPYYILLDWVLVALVLTSLFMLRMERSKRMRAYGNPAELA